MWSMFGPHKDVPDSERGAIAPLVAILLPLLCGVVALSVDAGLLQYRRRALQAAVDVAALSAARAPAESGSIVPTVLTQMDPQAKSTAIVVGTYTADPTLSAAARFVAGGSSPNAVEVSASRTVPLGLSQLFMHTSTAQVHATAVAQSTPLAAFTLGSGLVSLQGGVINSVLGALLGTNISLNAVSYTGLLNTQISALGYANNLAAQVGLSAGTYSQLLQSNIGLGNAFSVLSASAPSTTSTAALSALNTLGLAVNAPNVLVGNLLSLQTNQARTVGSFAGDSSYANLNLNAFDLVTAAATLGGANHAIALPASINLPGLANVSVQVLAIEPAQLSGGSAVLGGIGSTAQTAQVRVLLNVTLLNAVNGGVITLPILVQLAPAQAKLASIACQGDPTTDSTVTVDATTGVASAQIGLISNAQFANTALTFGTLSPAPILNVSLNVLGLSVGVKILAQASVNVGAGSEAMTFNSTEITNGTAQQIASGNLAGTLVSSLANQLVLTPQIDLSLVPPLLLSTVNSALAPLVSTLLTTVSTALTPVLSSLDGTVDNILAAAGVGLGTASVRVTGVRCGSASIAL